MEKTDAYVFYHSADFDGYLSCALIAAYLKYNNKNFVLKSYNYGNELDLDSLDKNAIIYAADISFDPQIMLKIKSEFKDFIWIDHHISAISNSEINGYSDLPGLRTTDHAACVLVWLYFKKLGFDFTEKLKFNFTCVKWIGEYDIWDHSDPNVLPFQYGLRTENLHPKSPFALNKWRYLLTSNDSYLKQVVKKGKIILAYIEQDNTKKCFSMSYVIDFENYKCVCANYSSNSQFFDKIFNNQKHDLMLLYSFNPKSNTFNCSIYSRREDVDCSKLAQKYGGGGHFHAAGFRLTPEQANQILFSVIQN